MIILAAIFAMDEKIKRYIEKNIKMHSKKKVCCGLIDITKYHNTGAAFNVLDKKPMYIKLFSSALLAVMTIILIISDIQKKSLSYRVPLAMISGGAASNVYDRIKRGYVVDYFRFNIRPIKHIIFNISDIFIFMGFMIIVIQEMIKKK